MKNTSSLKQTDVFYLGQELSLSPASDTQTVLVVSPQLQLSVLPGALTIAPSVEMANAALLIRSFDLIIFDAVAFSTERPAFFHQLRSLIGKPQLIVIGDVILSEIEEVMQVGYDYIAS